MHETRLVSDALSLVMGSSPLHLGSGGTQEGPPTPLRENALRGLTKRLVSLVPADLLEEFQKDPIWPIPVSHCSWEVELPC